MIKHFFDLCNGLAIQKGWKKVLGIVDIELLCYGSFLTRGGPRTIRNEVTVIDLEKKKNSSRTQLTTEMIEGFSEETVEHMQIWKTDIKAAIVMKISLY